ncbi:DUF3108 domain-containing protein [Salinisphaera sp. Q1T1-3]|uniref:DUF3108 domain-containing protein n=1 Tax=Salinisphaera sp. Q1T1-3 TaxID=2321229 RepID=UPI000E722746|nr:DUF3108 domain-containing protein [Salinisphaera sp. Q1T1-3]RJS94418.1 DUF3108 domain-containing protein [Salinisphaera sp. Q1T1-3]
MTLFFRSRVRHAVAALVSAVALLGPASSLAAAPGASDAELETATTPFDARFKVVKAGLPLGTTRFQLAAGDQPDCFVYRGNANPNALVHMFLGDITEQSNFCVVDGVVRPMRFRHTEAGKPKKSYTLRFDWSAGKAHYHDKAGRQKSYDIESGVQDPLSLQIAARAWVAQQSRTGVKPGAIGDTRFSLADDDGVEAFKLTTAPGGNVSVGAGRFNTLRVARSGDHAHTLVLWLATNRNWLPIQVETGHDGSTFIMQANQLTLGADGK